MNSLNDNTNEIQNLNSSNIDSSSNDGNNLSLSIFSIFDPHSDLLVKYIIFIINPPI